MGLVQDITGTANLVIGASRLKRLSDKGYTPAQMKDIYDDLEGFSEEQINGFCLISQGMMQGDISIPRNAFNFNKSKSKSSEELILA